jgi:single-strand DNA-binding protein
MDSHDADLDPVNHVVLRGRLAASPAAKELPSGDLLLVFQLTVPRPPGDRGRVDSIDCVTTRSRPRRSLNRAKPGDVLEVEGSLRRRFWRSPTGPTSRYAVDVERVTPARRLRRRPQAAASRARTQASA